MEPVLKKQKVAYPKLAAALAIQRAWRRSFRSTAFLVKRLCLIFDGQSVRVWERKCATKAARALAERLVCYVAPSMMQRKDKLLEIRHARPLLFVYWLVNSKETLLLWSYNDNKYNNSGGTQTVLSVPARRLVHLAHALHAVMTERPSERALLCESYMRYVDAFETWRLLDQAQKCSVFRQILIAHAYRTRFYGVLQLVCPPDLLTKGLGISSKIEDVRKRYASISPSGFASLEQELVDRPLNKNNGPVPISEAQIRHELFAMRKTELIDPQTGRGFAENKHFVFVRLELPAKLYANIKVELLQRFTPVAPTAQQTWNSLLRVVQEIKNTAVVASIGDAAQWDAAVDIVAIRGKLQQRLFSLGDIEGLVETMLSIIKCYPGSNTPKIEKEWGEIFLTAMAEEANEMVRRVEIISKNLAYLLRTAGQMQAVGYNIRLAYLTAPMLQHTILPAYPAPASTENTKAWLQEAWRFRKLQGVRSKRIEWLERSLWPPSRGGNFFAYAMTWFVFADFDRASSLAAPMKTPETLALHDGHRLVFLKNSLAQIIYMVASALFKNGVSRKHFVWFVTDENEGACSAEKTLLHTFESMLFLHVHHHAAGGVSRMFLSEFLSDQIAVPGLAELEGKITAFTDSMRVLMETSKYLFGSNTYMPLIEDLLLRHATAVSAIPQ